MHYDEDDSLDDFIDDEDTNGEEDEDYSSIDTLHSQDSEYVYPFQTMVFF